MNVQTLSPESAASSPTAVWDRLWRHVPSINRDDALLDRERRSPRWALIIRRLKAAFGTIHGLKTIELGSGRGDLSVLLAESGAKVRLLDASEHALDQARRRFERLGLDAALERADLFNAGSAKPRGFDVALSSGVIEHFQGDDRTRAIRAHFDVLRVGGLAVISVPNAWCPTYRLWKLYLELRGWWPYGLEVPYTKREILRRAKDVGFAQAEAYSMGFWQSVGDHWGRSLLGRGPDWVDRASRFDRMLGMSVVFFGRREA